MPVLAGTISSAALALLIALAFAGCRDEGPEPIQIRTPLRPDAAESHGDEAVWPQARVGKQRLGTSLSLCIEIERQHHILAERVLHLPPNIGGGKTLAPDHERRPKR